MENFQYDGAKKGLSSVTKKMHWRALYGRPRETLLYFHAGEKILDNLTCSAKRCVEQVDNQFQESDDIDSIIHLEGIMQRLEEDLCAYEALRHVHRQDSQTLFEIARFRRHARPEHFRDTA